MVDARLLAPNTTRGLKRVEYDQLVAMGALEDERVELLDGEIVTMSPNYPEHANPVQLFTELLVPPRSLAVQACVSNCRSTPRASPSPSPT